MAVCLPHLLATRRLPGGLDHVGGATASPVIRLERSDNWALSLKRGV
jgi:hypothetical protein